MYVCVSICMCAWPRLSLPASHPTPAATSVVGRSKPQLCLDRHPGQCAVWGHPAHNVIICLHLLLVFPKSTMQDAFRNFEFSLHLSRTLW